MSHGTRHRDPRTEVAGLCQPSLRDVRLFTWTSSRGRQYSATTYILRHLWLRDDFREGLGTRADVTGSPYISPVEHGLFVAMLRCARPRAFGYRVVVTGVAEGSSATRLCRLRGVAVCRRRCTTSCAWSSQPIVTHCPLTRWLRCMASCLSDAPSGSTSRLQYIADHYIPQPNLSWGRS